MLPGSVHQLVILVTVAKFGARYAISGHEYFASRAGLSDDKIATVAAAPPTLGQGEVPRAVRRPRVERSSRARELAHSLW